MANGMKPNVFFHGDPTYDSARGHISKERQKKERDIRDFFESLRREGNRLRSAEFLLCQYEADISGIRSCRYDREHVTGTKQSDVSDILIRLEEKLMRQRENFISLCRDVTEKREQAQRYISCLSDTEMQSILMDRYWAGLTWGQIAKNHHYERDYCMRLRSRAILRIAEKWS